MLKQKLIKFLKEIFLGAGFVFMISSLLKQYHPCRVDDERNAC